MHLVFCLMVLLLNDGIQIVQQYKSLQVYETWTISIKLFKFGAKHEN